jgi:hypothetical protein
MIEEGFHLAVLAELRKLVTHPLTARKNALRSMVLDLDAGHADPVEAVTWLLRTSAEVCASSTKQCRVDATLSDDEKDALDKSHFLVKHAGLWARHIVEHCDLVKEVFPITVH